MNAVEERFEKFVDGYIEAMLWADALPTVEEQEDNPNFETGGLEGLDVGDDVRQEVIERGQLREFFHENFMDLVRFSRRYQPVDGHDVWECAGHDHSLTREHHGTGFWDRGLGELGERLTKASQAYGSKDDHLLYDGGHGWAVL